MTQPVRHRFRSDFELALAKQLAEESIDFSYEEEKLSWVPKPKIYTPDFYLKKQDIYIEAKGHFKPSDRVKMLEVIKQNPFLDIRMVFLRGSNKLNRTSSTTYGQWCDRHGILWAERVIPKEWLEEKK